MDRQSAAHLRSPAQVVRVRRHLRRRPPKRVEPGSLYDIMHDHAGTSLYVLPICWTDIHTTLLGVCFEERPLVDKPVPVQTNPPQNLEPSRLARQLTSELHNLVRDENIPIPARTYCKNRAIKSVLGTLFPNSLGRPKTLVELDFYFGQRIFRKAVRIPCMWKTPSCFESSFDSAPTIPDDSSFTTIPVSPEPCTEDYQPNQPMLAYLNRSQLAMIRQNMFRVIPGPGGRPNGPVASLQQLRSKMLIPADVGQDPFIVAILIAMAQAHFYPTYVPDPFNETPARNGVIRSLHIPPPVFSTVKVQVITHDEGQVGYPNFYVYTAIVTPAFLSRFLDPHKAPDLGDGEPDGGLKITCTPVTVWPVLGLKERLAKALGREIAGDAVFDNPDHMGLWDDLIKPPRSDLFDSTPPRSSNKRRRGHDRNLEQEERPPLSEVLNSSFEEDNSQGADDKLVLSPDAKRRRTARRSNPLRVF